jgi:serine/threonine protein kinase
MEPTLRNEKLENTKNESQSSANSFNFSATGSVSNDEPQIGSQFAENYVIESILGSGGMGKVLRVRHTGLDRTFALKIILPDRTLTDADLERFRHEAQTLHDMRHENIVRIFEYGITPNGKPYQILDFVDGEPLSNFIGTDCPLSVAQRLEIAIQICRGLMHAHEHGVIHRDVKTSNILVQNSGERLQATLIDFGLAKSEVKGGRTLTRTGDIVGSPAYLSPEQALGQNIDCRTDVYSLGIVLYELFSGRLPFLGASALEQVMIRFHEKPPEEPLQQKTSVGLRNIIFKCLEQSRDNRYSSAQELLDDLQAIAAGEKPKAKRRFHVPKKYWIAGAAVGACMLFMLSFLTATYLLVRQQGSSGSKRPSIVTGGTAESVGSTLNQARIEEKEAYDTDQRAYAYYVRGDYAKCIEMLRTGETLFERMAVAEPDPKKKKIHRLLLAEKQFFIGECYNGLNKLEDARVYMDKAWQAFYAEGEMNPNANKCAAEFTEVLRKLGKNKEADKVQSEFETFKHSLEHAND